MTDSEILAEIERRIAEWFTSPGWAEENAGFSTVQQWIKELRDEPPRLISIEYDGEGRERSRFYRSNQRTETMTLADDLKAEAERLRRRHVAATRPRGPMSLDEAADLARRMAGEPPPDDATTKGKP